MTKGDLYMKRRLMTVLLVVVMIVSLAFPALAAQANAQALTRGELAAIAARLENGEAAFAESSAVAMDEGDEPPAEEPAADDTPVVQQDVAAFLLLYAGLKESQLGAFPDDYNAMAESVGLTKGVDYEPEADCSIAQFQTMLNNVQALYDAMHAEEKEPFFVDGLAQPIFEMSDATQANGDSGVVRFCVYVETNYDTDDDGKLDLVKALVQLPHEALDGMKVSTIYEARPYITGCTSGRAYVDGEYDISKLYSQPEARTPAGSTTTADMVASANPDDWYYFNPYENMYDYEDLSWYDYYLVRGFAVVECGGLGTKGSEGFETCGTDLEIDAFKCVIEWLHGDRVAYSDKTANTTIAADWSTGKVGMTGRSYAGTTQFGLATTGVEGLETIVPVAGIASWYEYTNSQGASTSSVAYSDYLAFYCAGRYLDDEDYATIADKYGRYLNQLRADQNALNGNYGAHWATRDYTLNADKIKCPALIVHGLNDTNVRTKEFDLMYKAYQQAGVDVKLMLHQGTHLTPSYPAQEYEIFIGDELYDTILNRWFSHYLYGQDNGAEDMAPVTVQSNVDGSWSTLDSWDTDSTLTFKPEVDAEAETPAATTVAYRQNGVYTFEIPEEFTVQGAIAVTFTAKPTSEQIDTLDNVRLTVGLNDTAAEAFPCFIPSRSYLPITTLKENGAWMGGGVANYDLVEYALSSAASKSIGQGYIDLYNPTAGYDSAGAAERTALQNGESYTYTVYLQPSVYTVRDGHTLRLSLSLSNRNISIDVDDASVSVCVPVTKAANPTLDALKEAVAASKEAVTDLDAYNEESAQAYADALAAAEALIEAESTDAEANAAAQQALADAQNALTEKPAAEKFTDVPADAYYHDAVYALVKQGVINGMTDTTFAPTADLSRAQFVTMLYRMSGSPEVTDPAGFDDVAAGSYYADAVAWAVSKEITNGTSETTFSPDNAVTREQMVTFLYRCAKAADALNDKTADLSAFTDADAVSAYAQTAFAWAVGNRIVNGMTADTLAPKATANRGQAATVLYRFSESLSA